MWKQSRFRRGLELVAVFVLALALPNRSPTTREASIAPPQSAEEAKLPEPNGREWALRINGWYIKVDGVAPGVAELPVAREEQPARTAKAISEFDDLIHRHAAVEGLDWRLVAALAYEESHFVPDSRSRAGAFGLMQIMPIAAEDVGAQDFATPDDNVHAGVLYLKRLDAMFDRAQGRDRLALVLAAYNAGPGHIQDAQALAHRYGYDENRWDNSMDLIVPMLAEPRFYRALEHGYADGRGIVLYVSRVLGRYERYKAQAGEWPPAYAPDDQAASASG